MKFFVAFAAFVAVAVAGSLHKPAADVQTELEAIIAAINSPSTDPATALLLQELLLQQLGVVASPVLVEAEPPSVGPVIVETPEHEPPFAGPELIDFPVDQSPVVVGPIPNGASPLVQIIVNVAGSGAGSDAVAAPAPAPVFPEPEGDAVQVVDDSVADDHIGVDVVDLPAAPVSPVQVGAPELPSPVVVLPDDLN